jgi:hypothetical protein
LLTYHYQSHKPEYKKDVGQPSVEWGHGYEQRYRPHYQIDVKKYVPHLLSVAEFYAGHIAVTSVVMIHGSFFMFHGYLGGAAEREVNNYGSS